MVMVAHFPPPVHGMAVSVAAFARILEQHAEIVRSPISPDQLERGPGYHLQRLGRVLRSCGVLARMRERARVVYVSADGGNGQLYTLAVVRCARLLGYRVYLHHMSYAYVDADSRVMRAIVRAGGDRCTHLVLCARMAREFAARYPGATSVRVAPVAFAMEEPGWTAAEHPREPGPLRLGHFGNLSEEKGLGRAFDALAALRARGVDAELVLGGPVLAAADRELLERGLAAAGDRAHYLGPLTGAGREQLLQRTDVFLFPTRYFNESYGLVAWEAMLRGIPVVANRAGCLDAEALDGGGAVLDPRRDFAEQAVGVLARWSSDPDARTHAGDAARATAEAARREALALARELAAELAAG